MFNCVQVTLNTQSTCVQRNECVRMYVDVTPFLYCNVIQYVFSLKNLSFICSSYFLTFYQFLRLQSFTFIFNYILKANFFNHECCRSIHCFSKLSIKSFSTCPRINLVDPVSNQDFFILEDQRLFTNFHSKQILNTSSCS